MDCQILQQDLMILNDKILNVVHRINYKVVVDQTVDQGVGCVSEPLSKLSKLPRYQSVSFWSSGTLLSLDVINNDIKFLVTVCIILHHEIKHNHKIPLHAHLQCYK